MNRKPVERVLSFPDLKLYTEYFGDPENRAVLLISGAMAPASFWPDFFCQQLADHRLFVIENHAKSQNDRFLNFVLVQQVKSYFLEKKMHLPD